MKICLEPEDHVICEDGARATFLRDIRGMFYALNGSYQCQEVASLSLTELLQGFFEFYGLFKYEQNAICVVHGKEITKRKGKGVIEVVNPLDPNLNSSIFVQEEALLRFRRLCLEAVRKLKYLESLQV